MRIVPVFCSTKRQHRLAEVEVHQGYAIVTPLSVPVYGIDERLSATIATGAEAAIQRFTIKADGALPMDRTPLVCRCREHDYPTDLWDQLREGRAVRAV